MLLLVETVEEEEFITDMTIIIVIILLINISMHRYSICSIDMHIEPLCIAMHQYITALSHLSSH